MRSFETNRIADIKFYLNIVYVLMVFFYELSFMRYQITLAISIKKMLK